MPNQPGTPQPYLPAAPPGQTPEPCTITPALLKTHSITPAEYESLQGKLGRTPSLTELGIFSVMWSEHCSYKSSRVHLKRLPTVGERTSGPGSVVQGPGENAGIIDVGDGWACAFKIESHNHPSYIEPYQGAATGVGGILRDIFTMNARPMAIMDSLRFGPLSPPVSSKQPALPSEAPAQGSVPPNNTVIPSEGAAEVEGPAGAAANGTDYHRNRHTLTGVVHGVAGYGNCFGVPNLGGETRFEPCYSGNPLVNAFALGLVRTDEIFYAKATGVGNPVIYVGAKTGRDGIHGATMASEEFTEGSEQKRPNVQMGDPFLEKLLLEACLEAMATGAVLGIQDMGAAGLTCSTCEMGARGELGVSIELDLVPQRETGMNSYEIMLSESQERMLLVAQAGREHEVLAVFLKWGLDASIVGEVTADDVMRVFHAGVLIAEIPNKALTDEAPVYNRPVGSWNPPVPKDPPAWVLEELKKPRDYTADLKKLLASPNICSKKWIYEQYDSMVQTNTVQGPGGEAGVIRIKGTGSRAQGPAGEGSGIRDQGSESEGLGPRAQGLGLRAPGSVGPAVGASGVTAPGPTDPYPLPDPPAPDFLSPAALAAPAQQLDPLAVQHSLLGKLASFVAESTPEGEATHLTGNVDAANPVVAPDATHTPGEPARTGPLSPKPYALSPAPERGLAMALAGNGRWCYLDPKLGAMHAVAEAARKVACTGATPVAATNCLNFGNPEKPEIMAQLSAAIDGIAEACTALGTPVTGGNVSLYNETKGEGIYPTPVIGVVGILDDVTRAAPNSFKAPNQAVFLITASMSPVATWPKAINEFGSGDFARTVLGLTWGTPPSLDLDGCLSLNERLSAAISEGLVETAIDVSDGGLACALVRASIPNGVGADLLINPVPGEGISDGHTWLLFNEQPAVMITCKPEHWKVIFNHFESEAFWCERLGTTRLGHLSISSGERVIFESSISEFQPSYSDALKSHLAAEVLA